MEEQLNKKIPISALEARTGEVAIYNPDDSLKLEVRLEQENVWLDRSQISILFGSDKTTIEKHINNALKEELKDVPTAAKFAALQKEGNRNLDMSKENWKRNSCKMVLFWLYLQPNNINYGTDCFHRPHGCGH